MIRRDRILEVPIDRGDLQEMRAEMLSKARGRVPGHACFANVHMLHEAWKDGRVRAAMEASVLVVPDGMPLARLLSMTGSTQARMEGMAVFPWLLRMAAEDGLPVAFFGADQGTLEAVRDKAARELPGLRIVAAIAPGHSDLPLPDDARNVGVLAASGAGMVFVALGCPKQELWMASHQGEIPALLLGVGNALRVWLGWEKRAPAWMRPWCLEWAVRLWQDPRRLWKRYLVSNLWFLAWAVPATLVRCLRRKR